MNSYFNNDLFKTSNNIENIVFMSNEATKSFYQFIENINILIEAIDLALIDNDYETIILICNTINELSNRIGINIKKFGHQIREASLNKDIFAIKRITYNLHEYLSDLQIITL